MSGLRFRYLAYFGPHRLPAALPLEPGLNVICGASETGKSFVVESIDFMLGQEDPVRDIPERDGYDRIRLAIDSDRQPPLTIDRSIEGGQFLAYMEAIRESTPQTTPKTLRWKHSAAREDTLSFVLLQRIGLASKQIRKNAAGETRTLSFRDLARLCVVTEEEIQSRGSPLLSGQYTTATAEYAVFKLLLTGMDDSALVSAREVSGHREHETGKLELLTQMIGALQEELDEAGADREELAEQLERIEASIVIQNEALSNVQREFNELLERRGKVADQWRKNNSRFTAIDEFIGRFDLLDAHYQTDLRRLEAIRESGSIFIHLEQAPCPLCGSRPGDQHLDSDCEGNTESVVRAADAEMVKINKLRRELSDTVASLRAERQDLQRSLLQIHDAYKTSERELNEVAAPAVTAQRTSYNEFISKRGDIRLTLERFTRLNRLVDQRSELESLASEISGGSTATRTQISNNLLDEFSKSVENILEEWHYPNASRVFFDEAKRDIQIAGKARGSTGKGLRAITHAAVKIGLMEFCKDRQLPHPGFVVLDSPLLAYWKPEGQDDDLRGTDVKDMFYRYLLGLSKDTQVIIVENEHPPDFVFTDANVVVFTKNPHQGRYGFFPVS